MIRLNNFYGHERVKLGDFICIICKNIIRDVLLTNHHVPELEIHYDTELQTSTYLSN